MAEYLKPVAFTREEIDSLRMILQKVKTVLNFYDLQRKSYDPGGAAMFHAAMEDLRKECNRR